MSVVSRRVGHVVSCRSFHFVSVVSCHVGRVGQSCARAERRNIHVEIEMDDERG